MRYLAAVLLWLPFAALAQQPAPPHAAAAQPSASFVGPPEWDPSWRWCRFNDDCVLLRDECRQYTSVNKKYMRRAYIYFTTIIPSIQCGTPIMLPNPKALCNTQIRSCEVIF